MSHDRWLTVTVGAAGAMVAVFGLGQLIGASMRPEPEPPPPAAVESPIQSPPAPTDPPPPAASTDPPPVPAPAPSRSLARGQPPMARTGDGPHGALTVIGDTSVALTFDDGPDPRWTPAVLKKLRAHRVQATFCVLGSQVEKHPELVREIVADGHTLCNHSWDHDLGLGSRSPAAIRKDLERTSAAIRAAAPGVRVSYYRQPGGAWTDRLVDVAHRLGMWPLHWAVDPQDWRNPHPRAIAEAVVGATVPGAVVLLHDGGGDRAHTVRALDRLLPSLADQVALAALPPGGPGS